jgi:putative SOS response-associated peptidase YedK
MRPFTSHPSNGSTINIAVINLALKQGVAKSMITTEPNELMKPEQGPSIHDRMPVILAKKDYERMASPG